METPVCKNSTSCASEFQFLGRWIFSSRLESRLKKLTTSTTYRVAIKSSNVNDENSKLTARQENEEERQTNRDIDVGNENLEPMNIDNAVNLDCPSQSQLLCTQDCTKSVANLREGPISSDELCRLSNEDLISCINGGSDDVIFNFCESVCSALQHQHRFVPVLCEKLLLPKIRDPTFSTCSRTLLPTIKRTFEAFPAEACFYLLFPLLRESDLHCKLDTYLSHLENGSKQTVLKSLLEGDLQILEEHHIPLFQNLLVTSVDKDLNEKLIDLLLASGNKLCKLSSFGKLLVCITEQIGPLLDSEAKTKLFSTIQAHKSIQKARVMKAFQSLPS